MNLKLNNLHNKFILSFFTITFLVGIIIFGIILLVDFLGIFNMPTFEGFNLKKPLIENHLRFYEAYQIIKHKPKTIFLGSSRVKCGFNSHCVEKFVESDYYNAAISGVQFDEIFAYFEHALYNQPKLNHVFIGIDFYSFNDFVKVPSEFSDKRLNKSYLIFPDLKNFYSIQGLKSSLKTIRANWINEEGDIPEILKRPYAVLNQLKVAWYKKYEISEDRIEKFKKIVKTCKEKNIKLSVFINPVTSMYWEMIYQDGKWDTFEELKRRLCEIYPIYDFSGYNYINVEGTKDLGGEFYYEFTHFKPKVGEMILKKMNGIEIEYSDFGILLTPNTVEESLKKIRLKRDEWIIHNQHVIDEIKKHDTV